MLVCCGQASETSISPGGAGGSDVSCCLKMNVRTCSEALGNQRASLKIGDRANATPSHWLVVSFLWISSENRSVSRTRGLKPKSFCSKHGPNDAAGLFVADASSSSRRTARTLPAGWPP